jgi:hypothetical protein
MWTLARAARLIVRPNAEWRSIAAQPASTGQLVAYAATLALIPPVAAFIGYCFVGFSPGLAGKAVRMPISWGVFHALVGYVVLLAGVWITAMLIEILAPRFQGKVGFNGALKLAAHAPTPLWLAGGVLIFPPIGMLSVLGVYSIYLLVAGLPAIARVPPDEAMWLVTVIAACYAIAALIAIGGFTF